MARSQQYYDQLSTLKAKLEIFLYRHPLDNSMQIMNVIDNAESVGELRLLQEYILSCIGGRAQASGVPRRAERV